MTEETNPQAAGNEEGKPSIDDYFRARAEGESVDVALSKNPTQPSAESSDGDAAPEKKADDTEAPAGKQEAKPKPSGLPRGVKRRLEREQKARAEAEAKAAELQAKLDALSKQGETAEAKPAEGDGAEEKPYIDSVPYPMESDYLDKDGKLDVKAYEEDVSLWNNEKPLKHDPTNKAKAEPKKEPEQQQAEPEQPAQQLSPVAAAFKDVQEILDESEGDRDLWKEFDDTWRQGHLALSEEMLFHLSENDEDTEMLVAAFIEKPRLSRQIQRKPTADQPQLMADLAKKLREAPKQKEIKPQDVQGNDPASVLPSVDTPAGSVENTSGARAQLLAALKDGSYLDLRDRQLAERIN